MTECCMLVTPSILHPLCCRALDDAEKRVLADRERLREAEVVAKEAEAR